MSNDPNKIPQHVIEGSQKFFNELCRWVMSVPAVKVGNRFRLDFKSDASFAKYQEVLKECVKLHKGSPASVFGFYMAYAVKCLCEHPLLPQNHDVGKARQENVDLNIVGVRWSVQDERFFNLLEFLDRSPIPQIAYSFLNGKGAYSTIADALNTRFDASVWAMPDVTRLPKTYISRNVRPNVFVMRELGFTNHLERKERIPSEEFLMILVKISHAHFWHTMKNIIEHFGGHVIEVKEPGQSRDTFVRDSAILLKNGQLLMPNFTDTINSVMNNNERDVLANSLKEVANVKLLPLDVPVDGGNFLMFDRVPGRELALIADTTGTGLLSAYNELKQKLPIPVMPLPIHPDKAMDIYHGDLAVAKLPDGRILCHHQFFLDDSYGKNLKRFIGPENYMWCDEETAVNNGLNLICVGNNIIMPYCSDNMRARLEKDGFNPITPEIMGLPKGSFIQGMGGPHCLTQEVPFDLLKTEVQKNLLSKHR